MKKTLLVTLLLLTVIVAPRLIMANQDNGCQKLSKCTVPAPTILKVIEYENKVVVIGVSWNETLVDIYIDGDYSGRAEMHKGVGDIGYFDYQLEDLSVKGSQIYAIARNLNERDRSIKSNSLE